MDGLHEDLNRVLNKPLPDNDPNREAEMEKLPMQIASDMEWQNYRKRNDSLVVDFFQGQFKNMMECLTCHKVGISVYSPTLVPRFISRMARTNVILFFPLPLNLCGILLDVDDV